MDEFDDLEIDTDEQLAEAFGIDDNGDFIVRGDNGATDIELRILAKNMEGPVRRYLERFPQWAQTPAE